MSISKENSKTNENVKVPDFIIEKIIMYLDGKEVMSSATLSKSIFSLVSKHFLISEISCKKAASFTLSKKIRENMEKKGEKDYHLCNGFISAKFKFKNIFPMLRININDENKGLLPLFPIDENKSQFIVNLSNTKYKAIFNYLKAGDFNNMKIKIEFMAGGSVEKEVEAEEIVLGLRFIVTN